MGDSTKFIVLNVCPKMVGNLSERILELVVCLAISKNEISGADYSTVKRLVRKGVLKEVLHLADHVVADFGLDVPLAEGVSDLSEPRLPSDILGVEVCVGEDIEGRPPPVVQVAPPLVVHSHVYQHHRRQVAGRG